MPATQQNINQVKDTIRNLLNLASNDAAAEGEVANALEFAQKMMAKYHLNESDIKEIDPLTIDRVDVSKLNYTNIHSYTLGKNPCSWESYLAQFIKEYIGSIIVYQEHSPSVKKTKHGTVAFDSEGFQQVKTKVVFNGPENDVYLAQNLFDEIALTISALARMKYGSHLRGDGRAYGDGFVCSLMKQLNFSKQQLLSTNKVPINNSTSLMVRAAHSLVKRKKLETTKYLKNQGIKLTNTQPSVINATSSAYADGQRDGKQFNTQDSRKNYDRTNQRRLT